MKQKDEMPTRQIAQMRQWIWSYSLEYENKIFSGHMSDSAAYTRYVCYSVTAKWGIDILFCMVLRYYCFVNQYDYDLIEPPVSALRKLLEQIAADGSMKYYWDEPVSLSKITDHVTEMFDSLTSDLLVKKAFSGKNDIKSIAKYIATAALVTSLRHMITEGVKVYEGSEKSEYFLWRITRNTMRDMTFNTIKGAISRYLSRNCKDANSEMDSIVKRQISEGGFAGDKTWRSFVDGIISAEGQNIKMVEMMDKTPDLIKDLFDTDDKANTMLDHIYFSCLETGANVSNNITERLKVLEKSFGSTTIEIHGKTVSVPSAVLIAIYIENTLKTCGLDRFKKFLERPLTIPESESYLNRKQTLDIMEKYNIDPGMVKWS